MLKLYKATARGEYLTLAGAGIIIDLIAQAIDKVNADPNVVVLRLHDGSRGAAIDVMFPTPHTFLFDSVYIEKGNLCLVLGGKWDEDNTYELPLADPNIADELVKLIELRASKHRKTKLALDCS